MKKIFGFALFALSAMGLFADNHEEFEKAMKTAGSTMGPLKKASPTLFIAVESV